MVARRGRALSILAHRLRSQLLSGPPAADPVTVTRRLLAVQAQDLRAARLAVRARTDGLHATDVDRALNDRELVVGWLNRGTLHLVCAEDYRWLHALTAPQLITSNLRRLAQEGVTPDAAARGVGVIERALAEEGPLPRGRLREHLQKAGIRTERQALVHILFRASHEGLIVRGPMAGREQAFVLTRDWLGPAPPVDRDRALGELGRRYLAGHGPAEPEDLAKWAGIKLADARTALLPLPRLPAPPGDPELPPPRLLGAFEPVLLGWASREQIVGDQHRKLVTTNGIFRPFMIVQGRAVGTWRIEKSRVALQPFGSLTETDAAALRVDGDDVIRFLSD